MKDNTLGFYSTHDLREAARKRLPHGLFEFMDRGNDDDLAMLCLSELVRRIRAKRSGRTSVSPSRFPPPASDSLLPCQPR